MINDNENIEYINPKFTEIFGYTLTDIPNLEKWFQKAFPDIEYRKKVQNEWEKIKSEALDGKSIQAKTLQIYSKNEGEKIIYMKPVKLENGKCFRTFQDITARVKAEKELWQRKQELEELNTALRVLLKRRNDDKTEMEERILYNIKDLVIPYFEKLENRKLDEEQQFYLSILKTNLKEIVSPFSRRLALNQINLTPRKFRWPTS